VDDRSGRKVVDDVAQGARIVRFGDGYVDKPDAELLGLAAGLKIPAASVSMMALIERRTFPPVTSVNCACPAGQTAGLGPKQDRPRSASRRAGPIGILRQRDQDTDWVSVPV
jgi:hypothetical protein